jgi:hypothetical protein
LNGKLCVLGVATWVSEGKFENMGIIQNMHNIKYIDEKTGRIKINTAQVSYEVPNA